MPSAGMAASGWCAVEDLPGEEWTPARSGCRGTIEVVLLNDSALAFVTDRALAILSTPDVDGRIHSVPVGFTWEEGVVRIITSDGTQKVRNVERAGHATVAQVEGPKWITLIGPAHIDRNADAVAHAVYLYSRRYRTPGVNPRRVVIVVAVDRVLASSLLAP